MICSPQNRLALFQDNWLLRRHGNIRAVEPITQARKQVCCWMCGRNILIGWYIRFYGFLFSHLFRNNNFARRWKTSTVFVMKQLKTRDNQNYAWISFRTYDNATMNILTTLVFKTLILFKNIHILNNMNQTPWWLLKHVHCYITIQEFSYLIKTIA